METTPWDDAAQAAYARKTCQIKSKKLARSPGFARHEAEDLCHALLLHLIRQMPKFDPSRGAWTTFVDRVVSTHARQLHRDSLRQKRGGGRLPVSVDAAVGAGDGNLLKEELFAKSVDGSRETGVLDLLDELPALHRAVCELLMQDPAATVARKLGVSRRQIGNIVTEIRRRLEEAARAKNIRIPGHVRGKGHK